MQQYIKDQLDAFPSLYINLIKYRYRGHWFSERIVDRQTDIVIEGYPRSANSFAVQAFRLAQPQTSRIATHVHMSSQVIQGVKLGIPCLVLIRRPEDCIVSNKALAIQAQGGFDKVKKDIPISSAIKWYLHFYRRLRPFHGRFVLARFEEVTADFGAVIERVNQFYGTAFSLYIANQYNQNQIFDKGGLHLSPSEDRELIKQKVKEEYFSSANQALVREAEKLYQEMLKAERYAAEA